MSEPSESTAAENGEAARNGEDSIETIARKIGALRRALDAHERALGEALPKVETYVREHPEAGLYAAQRTMQEQAKRERILSEIDRLIGELARLTA